MTFIIYVRIVQHISILCFSQYFVRSQLIGINSVFKKDKSGFQQKRVKGSNRSLPISWGISDHFTGCFLVGFPSGSIKIDILSLPTIKPRPSYSVTKGSCCWLPVGNSSLHSPVFTWKVGNKAMSKTFSAWYRSLTQGQPLQIFWQPKIGDVFFSPPLPPKKKIFLCSLEESCLRLPMSTVIV